jgi:hypothetical protein
MSKSFLVLFFKKELLASLTRATRAWGADIALQNRK